MGGIVCDHRLVDGVDDLVDLVVDVIALEDVAAFDPDLLDVAENVADQQNAERPDAHDGENVDEEGDDQVAAEFFSGLLVEIQPYLIHL